MMMKNKVIFILNRKGTGVNLSLFNFSISCSMFSEMLRRKGFMARIESEFRKSDFMARSDTALKTYYTSNFCRPD